jgi:hypothetical protein
MKSWLWPNGREHQRRADKGIHMSEMLFKKTDYSLQGLLSDIDIGRIGLPDIQRPFVWSNAKVRDLLDSMYRGYPVGYLLFWETGAASDRARIIGPDGKQKAPSLLIVDGQQRLTSLYAVMRGIPVLRDNFLHETIRISFNPLEGKFEVPDAATDRTPEFLPDISAVLTRDSFSVITGYLSRIEATRKLAEEERDRAIKAITRLFELQGYPFVALELNATATEEQVADVFVRINSEGKKLNQSDFILTLMSVFWDEGRTALEDFSVETRRPPTSLAVASAYNQIFRPEPDSLLRVDVGIAFRRGRLQHIYSLLRGKDLQTGQFSQLRREQQFERLKTAQTHVLNPTHWADYLNVVRAAGYRNLRYVSSEMALVFGYQFYLIGRTEYGVAPHALKQAVARWLFMSLLTGRYTGSTETQFEKDLALLPASGDANSFLSTLAVAGDGELTTDYWDKTLPLELATSSGRSPSLFAYHAAQVLCDARALFSKGKVADLLDPPASGHKKALERHHLFPKRYLKKLKIEGVRETNQIANYALVEWDDNIAISDIAPKDYWPRYAARFASAELVEMMRWHALPSDWWAMDYPDFLRARRPLIAHVIRDGFSLLATGEKATQATSAPTAPA